MAEESKFTDTLKRLRKPKEGASSPEPKQSPPEPEQASQRTSGKRSDPQWLPVTIYMRKSVRRTARRRLEDEEQGRDISTLVDELLTDWLSKTG